MLTGKYRQVCRGEHCSPVAFARQVDLQGRLRRAVNDRPYGLTRDFYYPVGRGDPTPPGKAFPLGGRWRGTRRMREKCPEGSPSSVTCGDSFPQRGKPKLPLYPPRHRSPTNRSLLFSYGGTAIVFKATNRNYTIIFITYNESSVIPKFPTCSAVFTGIRLPPYLSKLVNMVPWQKAINIGFTHFCATPARVTALSRWATVYYHSPIWSPRIVMSISSSQRNREKGRSKNDFA